MGTNSSWPLDPLSFLIALFSGLPRCPGIVYIFCPRTEITHFLKEPYSFQEEMVCKHHNLGITGHSFWPFQWTKMGISLLLFHSFRIKYFMNSHWYFQFQGRIYLTSPMSHLYFLHRELFLIPSTRVIHLPLNYTIPFNNFYGDQHIKLYYFFNILSSLPNGKQMGPDFTSYSLLNKDEIP